MFRDNRPPALRLFFASALLGLAVCALPAHAQDVAAPVPAQDEGEVVRINSELVQTDVMVFDKGGKFVDGLKAEQFELAVDGKPQAVSFFEQVTAGTFDEEAQLAAARGHARTDRAGASVLPLDRGRLFILFLDDLHVAPGDMTRARDAMLRFIDDEMGQNDEAAIFTSSGQLGFLQQMMDDKGVLRLAIKRLASRYFDGRESGEQTPMNEYQAYAIDHNDRALLDYFIDQLAKERRMVLPPRTRGAVALRPGTSGQPTSTNQLEQIVRSRARQLVQQASAVTKNSLTSLENVVRTASPLPGRKVLFFISDGFYIDTQNSTALEDLRRIGDAAARSGTVIYSVDAHGLNTSPLIPDASTKAPFDPGNQLAAANSASLTAYQEPLHTLAVETGGRALLDTNDLVAGVKQAVRETSHYYLLAWKPESEPEHGGKFRHIEVRVKDRPDLEVRFRRGYETETPAKPEASSKDRKKEKDKGKKNPVETELLAALKSQYPRRALPTSLSAGYMDTPTGDAQLTISVEVDAQALGLNADGSGDPASLDVVGAVVDDEGKAVSEFEENLTVAPLQTTSVRRRVIYNHQLQLKHGLYQVRVAARDRRTGKAGSAMQWLEIPDIKKGGLALSSLFVGETGDGSAQLAVCADRRFTRASRLGFFLYVYNAARAASSPDVALQVQIFRDDQPVVTRPLFKIETAGVADFARLSYGEDLSLESLPAGRYVLQITAIDRTGKSSASQRTSFIVE
jgi:VWFA-related protein